MEQGKKEQVCEDRGNLGEVAMICAARDKLKFGEFYSSSRPVQRQVRQLNIGLILTVKEDAMRYSHNIYLEFVIVVSNTKYWFSI